MPAVGLSETCVMLTCDDQLFSEAREMKIEACSKEADIGAFRDANENVRYSQILRLLDSAVRNIDKDKHIVRSCLAKARSLLEEETVGFELVEKGGLATWQITRVRAYIAVNISKPILVRDLARLVDLSVSHFSRAFIENFGEPPSAYVLRCRIERAKELMMTTDRQLCEIALESGMCDQSHFTRSFRRIVGTSPNIWRRSVVDLDDGLLPNRNILQRQ